MELGPVDRAMGQHQRLDADAAAALPDTATPPGPQPGPGWPGFALVMPGGAGQATVPKFLDAGAAPEIRLARHPVADVEAPPRSPGRRGRGREGRPR